MNSLAIIRSSQCAQWTRKWNWMDCYSSYNVCSWIAINKMLDFNKSFLRLKLAKMTKLVKSIECFEQRQRCFILISPFSFPIEITVQFKRPHLDISIFLSILFIEWSISNCRKCYVHRACNWIHGKIAYAQCTQQMPFIEGITNKLSSQSQQSLKDSGRNTNNFSSYRNCLLLIKINSIFVVAIFSCVKFQFTFQM